MADRSPDCKRAAPEALTVSTVPVNSFSFASSSRRAASHSSRETTRGSCISASLTLIDPARCCGSKLVGERVCGLTRHPGWPGIAGSRAAGRHCASGRVQVSCDLTWASRAFRNRRSGPVPARAAASGLRSRWTAHEHACWSTRCAPSTLLVLVTLLAALMPWKAERLTGLSGWYSAFSEHDGECGLASRAWRTALTVSGRIRCRQYRSGKADAHYCQRCRQTPRSGKSSGAFSLV